jgi:hypothetical protein
LRGGGNESGPECPAPGVGAPDAAADIPKLGACVVGHLFFGKKAFFDPFLQMPVAGKARKQGVQNGSLPSFS